MARMKTKVINLFRSEINCMDSMEIFIKSYSNNCFTDALFRDKRIVNFCALFNLNLNCFNLLSHVDCIFFFIQFEVNC